MSLQCDSPNLENFVAESNDNHEIMSGDDDGFIEEQSEEGTSIQLSQVQFVNNDLDEAQEEVIPTKFNESVTQAVELEQKSSQADSSTDDDHSPPTATVDSGQSHKDISLVCFFVSTLFL